MNAKKIDEFAGPECGNCTATKTKAGQPLSQTCNRCKLVSYCSRDCQVQHWKSGDHQKWCLTPKERSVQSALDRKEDYETDEELFGDEASCSVCLEPIVSAKADLNVTLPCLHIFHISCLEDLRSHALQQACPLCRAELPSQTDDSATKCCANCGSEKCPNGAPLVNCANCKLVFYCGRDFQGGIHDGVGPLFIAAQGGHAEMANALISSGAAVNHARTNDGATPLRAAALGHIKVVSLLIASGAAVNQARKHNGVTPLCIAAQCGNTNIVTLLIELGADTNQCQLHIGWSPVFVAAWSGHAKIVRILLEAGADKTVPTTVEHLDIEADCTPQSIAARLGHSEVSGLLSE